MDTNGILQNLSLPELEPAMNENQAAYWTAVGEHASDIAEIYSNSKIAWLSSSIDMGYGYNFVMPLRLEKVEQDEAIIASIERAKKHQVRTEWWISPAAVTDGLSERLTVHGFTYMGGPVGMAVDLMKLNEDISRPANFVIKHVENEVGLREWVDTLVEGWPLPEVWRAHVFEGYAGFGLGANLDLRHYVGYVDGVPVTASSLLFAAGVAGIYAVATRPSFRGCGLGAIITLTPLLQARDKGYRVGILQASSLGHSVYKRLGFEDVFCYQSFQWPAPESA
jgi:GNAT superfamily N-acetyltransferase